MNQIIRKTALHLQTASTKLKMAFSIMKAAKK